jgi:hypothetical protein
VIDLDAAYDVLVQTCGASEAGREMFLAAQPTTEYRFIGLLGFGGKFWLNDGRVYVTCYPEDETDERRGRIAVANHLLAELVDPRQPTTRPATSPDRSRS